MSSKHSSSAQAAREVAARRIGADKAGQFVFEDIPMEEERHVFELDSEGERIIIRGSSPVAMAFGFNWYLKYYCQASFSWSGSRLELPSPLPKVGEPIRKVRPYKLFYNLNYVVFSYSMAFWDWDRFEQELDWMALNGIDLMLEMTGHEEVWRRTLARVGYSEVEIADYLCGPGYYPFQWLGCMYGWGGNTPERWYTERVKLAKRIHSRMKELGMTRILQAYTGIVPPDFKSKAPQAQPLAQGDWVGMERPSILLPDDPAFSLMADAFYEEQEKLFGTDHYYAGDPFHEGGNLQGVDLTKAAQLLQQAMVRADSRAVWVLQGWWENPTPELMAGLDKAHTLILDLWGEHSPRWKREGEGVFQGLPWIWTFLHNFGGRSGLYGDLKGSVNNVLEALHHPDSVHLQGMGLAPEGIEQNPVMYDLMTEMGWRTEIDLDEWLRQYLLRRYGLEHEDAGKAWELLRNSAYGYSKQPGPTQSVINQRPSKAGEDKVFKWDSLALYYDRELVEEACRCLYRAYPELSGSDGYLYDLVDVARQALANKAKVLHKSFMDAYKGNDRETFVRSSEAFLELIEVQDTLLNTRKEFMLGPWLEQARRAGVTPEEQQLYEFNARAQITIWSTPAEATLHDYANKEWGGLTRDFYLPRWQMYLRSLLESLDTGEPQRKIDWHAFELEWASRTDFFPTEPAGDIGEIVGRIVKEYL